MSMPTTDPAPTAREVAPRKPRARKPAPKPSQLVVEDIKQSVEAAREAVVHAGAAVEHGRQAIPEVTDVARAALDERFEQMKAVGHEAADVAVDQLDQARDLIVEQVKARPLTTALVAVGAGVLLGLLISGNRR
jgi:ElaB/YqjD/DUF883 family membrane-anchored ribosome-binding protein